MKSIRLFCISMSFLALAFIPSLMIASNMLQESGKDDRSCPTVKLPESFTGLDVSHDGGQALVWKHAKMDAKAASGGEGHAVGNSGNSIALVDLKTQKVLGTKALGFAISKAIVDANFIYVVPAEKKQCHVLDKTTLQEKSVLKVSRFISHIESDDEILVLNSERFTLPALKKTTPAPSTVAVLSNVTDVSVHRSRAGITRIQPVSMRFSSPSNGSVFRRPEKGVKNKEIKPMLFKGNNDNRAKKIDAISAKVVGWKQGGEGGWSLAVGVDVYTAITEPEARKTKRPKILETIELTKKKRSSEPKKWIQLEVHGSKVVLLANDMLFIWDASDYQPPGIKKALAITKSKPKLLKPTGTTFARIEVNGGNGPYQFKLLEACKGVSIASGGNIIINNEDAIKDCQARFIKRIGKQFSKVTGFDKLPADFIASYEEEVAAPFWKTSRRNSQSLPVRTSVKYLVTDKDSRTGIGELQLFMGVDKKEVTDRLQKFYVDIPWVVAAKKRAATSKKNAMLNQFRKGIAEFQSELQKLNSEKPEGGESDELRERVKVLEKRMDNLSKQLNRIEKLIIQGTK